MSKFYPENFGINYKCLTSFFFGGQADSLTGRLQDQEVNISINMRGYPREMVNAEVSQGRKRSQQMACYQVGYYHIS